MSRQTITRDEREQVIQMFGQPMDTEAISKLLGIDEAVIARVIREHREDRNIDPLDYENTQITDYHKR